MKKVYKEDPERIISEIEPQIWIYGNNRYNFKCNRCGTYLRDDAFKCKNCGSYDIVEISNKKS